VTPAGWGTFGSSQARATPVSRTADQKPCGWWFLAHGWRSKLRGREEAMSLSNTWERLYRAVATLTTADAPLKERLASAFHSHLLA